MSETLNQAGAALAAGRTAESETLFRNALTADANNVIALHGLALALWRQNRIEEAAQHLIKITELTPSDIDAWCDLAVAFLVQNKVPDALAILQSACKQFPDSPVLTLTMAAARERNKEYEEALRLCKQVIKAYFGPNAVHKPSVTALCNLSFILYNNGLIKETIPFFQLALQMEPHNVDALHSLSRAQLTLGDFEAGFRGEEARFLWRDGKHYAHDPWNPSTILPRPSTILPIDWLGKKIILVFEQGIGDELFFLRFVPLLRKKGAHVTYLPGKKIADLVGRSGVCNALVSHNAERPVAEYLFPIGDAPLLAQMSWESGPPPAISIPALPEAKARALAMLEGHPKPWIGLTWRAGTSEKTRELSKNIPLQSLLATLPNMRCTWVILQRNPEPEEIARVTNKLRGTIDASALNDDLEAMLGMLDVLDDYVGVSNTNMHLRAGLGKTARVLMPVPPDFRWMASGDESPWFPGFKIYRAMVGGNWKQTLSVLCSDLRKAFKRVVK